MTVLDKPIQALYERLQQKLPISEFNDELAQFWEREICDRKYLNEIRLSRKPCKRLMDEVMPVSRFMKLNGISSGFIQFPLNDQIPDCLLWQGDQLEPRLIEVTVALAAERFLEKSELIEKGELSKSYSTNDVLLKTITGVQWSLKRKDQGKYANMDLLISGPLNAKTLPCGRWGSIQQDLIKAAQNLPFREVHVIGDDTEQPIGFQIK